MEIDILQENCGVGYYRLDDQESNCFNFEPTLLRDLLNDISYSESFIDAAIKAASNKGITKARWVIAQYDFEYNPRRIVRPISTDPIFIGVFPYVVS